MPKFQKVRQNPPRLARFRGMGSCFCCANISKPKFVRVLSGSRKGGKKADKDRSLAGRRCDANSPKIEVTPELSPKTQETQPNGQGSERCHQHSTHGCHSTIGVFARGAGGAAAPPVSKKFGQNAKNSGKMPEFLAFF